MMVIDNEQACTEFFYNAPAADVVAADNRMIRAPQLAIAAARAESRVDIGMLTRNRDTPQHTDWCYYCMPHC